MNLARTLLSGAAVAALVAWPALAQDTAAEPADEAAETAAPAEPAEGAEAPAADVTADTVVATVNGESITLGHLIVARARLPQEYQALPPEMLFNGLLEQMIQQLALGMNTERDLSKGSELALENERRAFLAGEALSVFAETAVSDEALDALYRERFADAEPAQEFNASHILVETEEQALAIKARIDGGEEFAEVAREQSTGPSGPNGGDLGWFTTGMMVEPFETAVTQLSAGEVSDPVETQFGWHVIRLNETRRQEVPPLEQVAAELTEELQRGAIEAAVAGATEGAEIVRNTDGIDPTVLMDLDLVSQ
jgi:peptidyl-prolyl cis-trans isomerase C